MAQVATRADGPALHNSLQTATKTFIGVVLPKFGRVGTKC